MSRRLLMSADAGRPQAESYRIFLWSSLLIAAFFFGISLLSSPIPGINEPHYLAKSRAFDDPSWCSRDFFLTSGNAHYWFFLLTGMLTHWWSLEAIAFGGRAISCLLLGVGWSVLGGAVDLSTRWRIFSASVFATLTLLGSFSGEWLLGGFESKVPAWGLGLMAAGLWIYGQTRVCPGWLTAAGVVCGLACSLHPVVGGWMAVCMCLASGTSLVFSLLREQKVKTAKWLRGLTCFTAATLLCSLPGLIPALRIITETGVPLKDRQLAAFYQVFWRLRHHLDPMELTVFQWLFAVLVGAGLVWGVRALRRFESTTSHSRIEACPAHHSFDGLDHLLALFMMSAVIALAGVMIGWHTVPAKEMTGWEWRASLLKFYPFRCFDGLLSITAAIVVGRLAQQRAARITRPLPSFQTLLIFAIFMLLPLLQAWRSREVTPAGYTLQQFEEWQEACDWIRKNTAAEALILTPRESFAFKWFAERAEFVCYKDCPQNTAGILTWNERLWLLHDWTLKSSSDGLYGRDDLLELRKATNCDYILTRILGPFDADPVWQGQQWRIYAVPTQD